jgi:hypothetical protein
LTSEFIDRANPSAQRRSRISLSAAQKPFEGDVGELDRSAIAAARMGNHYRPETTYDLLVGVGWLTIAMIRAKIVILSDAGNPASLP